MRMYFFIILFCFSCGKKSSKGKPESDQISNLKPPKEYSEFGSYRAILRPINSKFASTSGKIDIKINNYEFIVKAQIENSIRDIKHFQSIMTKESCPSNLSDENKDLSIDFNELLKVSGEIILPLDSNLNEQFLGIDFGPISNSDGKYTYFRSTFYDDLLADLRDEDPDPFDHYAKLKREKSFFLENKVIVITAEVNDSVFDLSSENQEVNRTNRPVACGKFIRIKDRGDFDNL